MRSPSSLVDVLSRVLRSRFDRVEKMLDLQGRRTIDSLSDLHVGTSYAGGLSRDLEMWILVDRGLDPFPVAPEDGLQACGA